MLLDPPDVYSRNGVFGTGTTESVVKVRVPGSISRATTLNTPSPGEMQRTDLNKSDISAEKNVWSRNWAIWPRGASVRTSTLFPVVPSLFLPRPHSEVAACSG